MNQSLVYKEGYGASLELSIKTCFLHEKSVFLAQNYGCAKFCAAIPEACRIKPQVRALFKKFRVILEAKKPRTAVILCQKTGKLRQSFLLLLLSLWRTCFSRLPVAPTFSFAHFCKGDNPGWIRVNVWIPALAGITEGYSVNRSFLSNPFPYHKRERSTAHERALHLL